MRINAFDPDDIKVLVTAFEAALQKLRLVDRTDPVTLSVAKRIIALAQQGERDPIRLRDAGCNGCGVPLNSKPFPADNYAFPFFC